MAAATVVGEVGAAEPGGRQVTSGNGRRVLWSSATVRGATIVLVTPSIPLSFCGWRSMTSGCFGVGSLGSWQGEHGHGERGPGDLRGGPVEADDEAVAAAGADGLHDLQVRGQQHRAGG